MDEQVRKDILTTMKAFDDGVFVRNTSRDGESDWAIQVLKPLAAIARLQIAAEEND